MKNRNSKWLVAGLVACLSTSFAQATSTVFNNEASFLNSAGFLNLESFEDETVTNNNSQTNLLTLTNFTLSSTTTFGVFNAPAFGQSASHGSNFIGSIDEISTTTFSFASGINTFGINILDFGDFGGSSNLTFTNGVDNFIAALPSTDGSTQFFGIISDVTFNSVTFSHLTAGESYGLDEVYYGVPEPFTIALLGLGLAGISFSRRKKTRNNKVLLWPRRNYRG